MQLLNSTVEFGVRNACNRIRGCSLTLLLTIPTILLRYRSEHALADDMIHMRVKASRKQPLREFMSVAGGLRAAILTGYPRLRPCGVDINTLVDLINWMGRPQVLTGRVRCTSEAALPDPRGPSPLALEGRVWRSLESSLSCFHRSRSRHLTRGLRTFEGRVAG